MSWFLNSLGYGNGIFGREKCKTFPIFGGVRNFNSAPSQYLSAKSGEFPVVAYDSFCDDSLGDLV